MTDTSTTAITPRPTRKSYTSAKDAKINTPYEIEIDGHVFTTRPGRIPGVVQIDFSGFSYTHDSDSMWRFFKCAFVDDEGKFLVTQYEEFHDFLSDPSRSVQAELLGEIISDMVEFANGLPTGQSSS